MTDAPTKTAEKTETPQVAPAAQPVATINRKEQWEVFRDELNKRADEIGSQLPSNVSREKFIGASLAAVKSTPGILTATPRSLMSALTKAAQDGLLPDGREGIITVYSQKVPNSNPAQYENVAQWNPMFYGIRKRARELDGIIIDAQVVYVGDEFEYELGDNPFIKHKPKPRDTAVDASAGLAVYAIFRHPAEGILSREVMWKPEVFAVMNQSRAKTSLMWTTFWTEGWRKTVGRRGAKSVPVSPQLERLIQRDDENFSFDQTPPQITGPRPTPPSPPPAPTAPQNAASNDEPKGDKTPAEDLNNDDSGVSQPVDLDAYLTRAGEEIGDLDDEESVIAAWEELGVEATITANTDEGEGREKLLDQASAIRNRNLARVNGQGDLLGGEKPFPGDTRP